MNRNGINLEGDIFHPEKPHNSPWPHGFTWQKWPLSNCYRLDSKGPRKCACWVSLATEKMEDFLNLTYIRLFWGSLFPLHKPYPSIQLRYIGVYIPPFGWYQRNVGWPRHPVILPKRTTAPTHFRKIQVSLHVIPPNKFFPKKLTELQMTLRRQGLLPRRLLEGISGKLRWP